MDHTTFKKARSIKVRIDAMSNLAEEISFAGGTGHVNVEALGSEFIASLQNLIKTETERLAKVFAEL